MLIKGKWFLIMKHIPVFIIYRHQKQSNWNINVNFLSKIKTLHYHIIILKINNFVSSFLFLFALFNNETVSRMLFSVVLVAVFEGLLTSSKLNPHPISLYRAPRSRYCRPCTQKASPLCFSSHPSLLLPFPLPPSNPPNLASAKNRAL